jgi:hypothetical protein
MRANILARFVGDKDLLGNLESPIPALSVTELGG